MPIRIMHVVDNMGKGGLENGLANLIERMDSHRFEHTVLATRRLGLNAERLSHRQVRFLCLGKKENDSVFQLKSLVKAVRDCNPHIVHSRNWSAIEAIIAGRWVRFPALVHSEHGFDAAGNTSEPRRRTWLRRLAFELADQVMCVSHQLSQFHSMRTGFPITKMTVIHNGVDTRKFFPDPAMRARMRHELGFPHDCFCIGCVGNLTAVKDYTTVLQAVNEFSRHGRNWRLIIAGDGPERPKLESYIRAHPQWSEHVLFQGLSDQIPALLNAFDTYVLTSLIEGISNSLLEAMATGLPVIVTDTGGNPEVVTHNESGLLFPVRGIHELAQWLCALQQREDLRTQLGRCALSRVQKEFSIECMVRKYEQLYTSLAPQAIGSKPVSALRAGVEGRESWQNRPSR